MSRPRLETLADLTTECTTAFESAYTSAALAVLVEKLQTEYKEHLESGQTAMFPSFHHTLPTGSETGEFVVMDVGGSTVRVGKVRLVPADRNVNETGEDKMMRSRAEVVMVRRFAMDESVRQLDPDDLFDWIAVRLASVLSPADSPSCSSSKPTPIGFSWSFPMSQTSVQSATIVDLGKGFSAGEQLQGRDMAALLSAAFDRIGLSSSFSSPSTRSVSSTVAPVRLAALVNDSEATLLAHAYCHPGAHTAAIVGTGFNAAVYAPLHLLGQTKFGSRPAEWWTRQSQPSSHSTAGVVVNTELGLFGLNAIKRTRWDEELNSQTVRPDYQPLELIVGGRNIGEIVRLVCIDASSIGSSCPGSIFNHDLFKTPYALTTELIGRIVQINRSFINHNTHDQTEFTDLVSTELIDEATRFNYPSSRSPSSLSSSSSNSSSSITTVSPDQATFFHHISVLISNRAIAYTAAALFALVRLDLQSQPVNPSRPSSPSSLSSSDNSESFDRQGRTPSVLSIGYDGSVIACFPSFKSECERILNKMLSDQARVKTEAWSLDLPARIELVPVEDASLVGAAVAAACADRYHSGSQ